MKNLMIGMLVVLLICIFAPAKDARGEGFTQKGRNLNKLMFKIYGPAGANTSTGSGSFTQKGRNLNKLMFKIYGW